MTRLPASRYLKTALSPFSIRPFGNLTDNLYLLCVAHHQDPLFLVFQTLTMVVGSGLDVVSFQLLPMLVHLDFLHHQPSIAIGWCFYQHPECLILWGFERTISPPSYGQQAQMHVQIPETIAMCILAIWGLSHCACSQSHNYHHGAANVCILHTCTPTGG